MGKPKPLPERLEQARHDEELRARAAQANDNAADIINYLASFDPALREEEPTDDE